MKTLIVVCILLVTGVVNAQSGDTAVTVPQSMQTQAPPGSPQSDNPAATTGTAPVDSNIPSGTATTGTSGLTMNEAEKEERSFLWMIILAVAVAVMIVIIRNSRKRKTTR